ncbi:zinc/iron-chelating domain-containing protein [Pseudoxanthomonas jiangsuensis]|uniref:YkgJ family cysteine cluster protein n=1 Tax=Pseudoxanthomonas jiangsuensis TaxID=619688 RepID=UPI0013917A35|nr:YkgJ family cysteine cluster protein [Pseudoxanthomonas jiangsuensis]KAF1692529.1 zinc/iron-chelating domain-containing protein [Pseudoxanthomonas jiangsuensis]
MACTRCDAVCCRLPVLLLPGDRVPPHLVDRDPSGLEVMAQDEDGWCAAIDPLHLRCTIYPQRPAICRQFEMGGPACLDVRTAYRERRLDDLVSSLA